MNLINNTQTSNNLINPTLIWCLLMPVIHFLSLFSNVLCIIVFCSKTFIHKPIAIYFICLLVSDSTTLLIGYTEMLDREAYMIDKSSLLCLFNGKLIHGLTDFVYTFMGKICLEWMLYKVLWTRASTILLAILSIQRSRTFFSLSYRESRCCALLACLMSIFIASSITWLEWVGVQSDKSPDSYIYTEIFQSIMNQQISKEFYSDFLSNHYDESTEKYYCIRQSLNISRSNDTIFVANQSTCSAAKISSEFYSLTQSLVSNRDGHITGNIYHILTNIYDNNIDRINTSHLINDLLQVKSSDVIIKLFEKRSCHITLAYTIYLKLFHFLHSLSFSFNRHTLAIFFGNALPSFIVFLANLLSLKVIFFSESLKYLKYATQKSRSKRRFHNDMRAFLVILIESFSVITISWGIPIFLTMYHCHTLYVVSISACPQIKGSLAIFLFTDLFNSSTNCLLYSLSGKLFRRKFISIIKTIFTCGRGTLWNVKQNSSHLPTQNIEVQRSNEASLVLNYSLYSRAESCRHSELLSTIQMKKLQNLSKFKRISEDDRSLSMIKTSDEKNGSNDSEVQFIQKLRSTDKLGRPQSFKTFLLDKVQFLSSSKKEKTKPKKTVLQKRQLQTAVSISSTSGTGSNGNGSLRKQSENQRHSSKTGLVNDDDNQSITNFYVLQNVTTL